MIIHNYDGKWVHVSASGRKVLSCRYLKEVDLETPMVRERKKGLPIEIERRPDLCKV
jgi:hypothetical protein